MERYFAGWTTVSDAGQESGWIAVVGSPGSQDRIGMAIHVGPEPGGEFDRQGHYQLTVRGAPLEGEWILKGREFVRKP